MVTALFNASGRAGLACVESNEVASLQVHLLLLPSNHVTAACSLHPEATPHCLVRNFDEVQQGQYLQTLNDFILKLADTLAVNPTSRLQIVTTPFLRLC